MTEINENFYCTADLYDKSGMKTEYKYLTFVEIESTGKTKRYTALSDDTVVGNVQWYVPWRKYCYNSLNGVIYDASCLADVQDFLNQLMQEHKSKKEAQDDTGESYCTKCNKDIGTCECEFKNDAHANRCTRRRSTQ